MAKNKNRKQSDRQDRSPQAEQAREPERRSSTEERQSPLSPAQGSPAHVARRKQRSFGHN